MLQTIEEEVRYTQSYLGIDQLDPRVMKAMAEVPRHEFVPAERRLFAYDNGPLYIGHGQTISQPYIVAVMTHFVAPQKDHRVLDVGTGSGYQAAVLSRLVKQVYGVERIETLAEQARQRFRELGYDNIQIKVGDGVEGWIEHAPYDGIVVAAAAPYVPTALVAQLKSPGKMVIPLGQPSMSQELVLLEKSETGEISTRNLLPVAFVPLVSDTEPVLDNTHW